MAFIQLAVIRLYTWNRYFRSLQIHSSTRLHVRNC